MFSVHEAPSKHGPNSKLVPRRLLLEDESFLDDLLTILRDPTLIQFLDELECHLTRRPPHLGTTAYHLLNLISEHLCYDEHTLNPDDHKTRFYGWSDSPSDSDYPIDDQFLIYKGLAFYFHVGRNVTIYLDKPSLEVTEYELDRLSIAKAITFLALSTSKDPLVWYPDRYDCIEPSVLIHNLRNAFDSRKLFDFSQKIRFSHLLLFPPQNDLFSTQYKTDLRTFAFQLNSSFSGKPKLVSVPMRQMELISNGDVSLHVYDHFAGHSYQSPGTRNALTLVKLTWESTCNSEIYSLLSKAGFPLEIQRMIVMHLVDTTFNKCECNLDTMELPPKTEQRLYPITNTHWTENKTDVFCTLAFISLPKCGRDFRSSNSRTVLDNESDLRILSPRHLRGAIFDYSQLNILANSSEQIQQIAAMVNPPSLPVTHFSCTHPYISMEDTFYDELLSSDY